MCRNIKTLYNFDPPVTPDEVRAASLQFVRKISGFNKPSKANEPAFLAAIDEIANVSLRLLQSLETTAPPKTAKKKPQRPKPAPPKDSAHNSAVLSCGSGLRASQVSPQFQNGPDQIAAVGLEVS